MKNEDPCFGCSINKTCSIRYNMFNTNCPCKECIVKPICMVGCEKEDEFRNDILISELKKCKMKKIV